MHRTSAELAKENRAYLLHLINLLCFLISFKSSTVIPDISGQSLPTENYCIPSGLKAAIFRTSDFRRNSAAMASSRVVFKHINDRIFR
jgi:hypothetical protein